MRIAPQNTQGVKILANALTTADLQTLNGAVLRHCDAKDGLKDGLINDWQGCDFNPDTLKETLGEAKAQTIEAIFAGAHNSRGESLYANFPYHASLNTPAWKEWWIGIDESVGVQTLNNILTIPLLLQYFMQPNGQDALDFNFDADVASTLSTRGSE